ncbi:hypothetical protein ACWCPQ_07655 [Nocardia sp. NPDC001965]
MFCRATSRLATRARTVQDTYGNQLRTAVAGVRAQARAMPEADRHSALRVTLSSLVVIGDEFVTLRPSDFAGPASG